MLTSCVADYGAQSNTHVKEFDIAGSWADFISFWAVTCVATARILSLYFKNRILL
jgi:hypothetical protein